METQITNTTAGNDTEDVSRSTGDWEVYKYYMKSTGTLNVPFFLAFALAMAFCSNFQGELILSLNDSFFFLTL
jgi:hypothetical protein